MWWRLSDGAHACSDLINFSFWFALCLKRNMMIKMNDLCPVFVYNVLCMQCVRGHVLKIEALGKC